MKNIKLIKRFACLLLVAAVVLGSCKKNDELDRMFEGAKVVGVKINGELYLPTYDNDKVNVNIPAGKDLSKVKVQVLVANGNLKDFENDKIMDARMPIPLVLRGDDGASKDLKLRIISPPSLSNLIIEGLTIPKTDIFFSSTSLIVQVPVGTNLTALKVTMTFVNGTLQGFTNGTAMDYTNPKTFSIKGVDESTIYDYDLIVTTDKVGPASVKSMTINGIATDSVVLVAPSTIVPYVKGLTDFSKSTVTIVGGFGNKIDPSFTGTNLNLLLGTSKVKITGSDGIQKEFTIGVPQLSLKPVFEKKYEEFNFGANDLAGAALSGNHVVVSNYSAVAPAVVGPNYYDLTGKQEGVLNKTGVTIAHSLRKVATDTKGKILVLPLGLSSTDQTIYKWDDVTATPTPYITYSSASLGVTGSFRSAGINISGDLTADAIITVGRAQSSDVFVWKVTGGVLNPVPTKYNIPYTGLSFYFSVEPMPIGTPGYVSATITNGSLTGLAILTNTMEEVAKKSGLSSTDAKVYKLNGRTYLAYTVYATGKGAYFRVNDITEGNEASLEKPIMDILMPSAAANGNGTMAVDMAIINGKLHALFACTNIGMRLYKLEQ